MKHNVGIVLLSIVFVLLLSFALADDTVTAMYFDDYSYVYLDDGSICITEYTGNSKKVSVPAQIDGKPVTQIGTLAFAEYETSNITAVTLPDTIVSIKSLAFSGCTKLTKINLPDGLIELGDFAFVDCGKLSALTLPASLTTMGSNPFAGCSSLKIKLARGQEAFELYKGILYSYDGVLISATGKLTSANIQSGTTTIGAYAFSGQDKLKKITLPNTITDIKENAFDSCTALRDLTLSESLVNIGAHAFFGCEQLQTVVIPASCIVLTGNPFAFCTMLKSFQVPETHPTLVSMDGVLFDRDTMTLVAYPAAKGSIYTVPDGTCRIGDEAFYACQSLTAVHLPESVTQIGEAAFRLCIQLTDLNLPDGITTMGKWALASCGFQELHLPTALTEISNLCFDGCSKLTCIDIPDGVTAIGDSAFQQCFQLKQITIPESVTEIGQNAFNNCSLTSIALPHAISVIRPYTFVYCSSLQEIVIPDGVTEIGEWAFEGCYSLSKVTVPASVQTIGDRAFDSMTGLVNFITPTGSAAEAYATVDEDHPWHLVWMRDGQVYRDLPYAHDLRHPWNVSSFIPVNDECYVLLPPIDSWALDSLNDPDYVPAVEIYHWTDNGMELIASIPGQWDRQNIKVAQEGFIIYDKDNGDLHSYRYDGTLLSSCHLYDGENDYLLRYSADKDGTQFVTISTSGYPHPSCTLYAVKEGQILWKQDYRWYISTVCPGDGYVYAMWNEKDEVISPVRIERMDPMTGKVLVSRSLSANKLVLALSLTVDPVSGNLVIFGRSVARSRDQYNAFVMVLDDDMKELSLDVRRFCYYQSDYFSVMNLPDGSFAVYANGTYEDDVEREPDEPMPPSGEPIIVPYEVLPEADRNGIKIK